MLPTITEALTSQRFEAGPEWFDQVTCPQFGALVLIMGFCPLLGRTVAALKRLRQKAWWVVVGAVAVPVAGGLAGFTQIISIIGFAVIGLAGATTLAEYVEGVVTRRKRTGEALPSALWHLFRLQRRKYGGYLVHTGIIVMALGIVGTRMYPFEIQKTLNIGQPATVGDYTITFERLNRDFIDDYTSTWATVTVYRHGEYLATLEPRLNRFTNEGQTITVPALQPGLREDFYLILSGWTDNGTAATFKVVINALVNFLWLGGLVFLAGGGLALWPKMQNPIWNAIALVVDIALLAGAAWAMWGIPHGVAPGDTGRPLVGQAAPDFRLNLLDGGSFAPADARGKVVVINLWSSWCPSCEEEMPDLQHVWENYRGKGATFVGVAYRDEESAVRNSLVQYGTTYAIGLDSGDRIAKQYGITGIPETFVIDLQGNVAYVHIGDVSGDVLAAEINSLLKQEQKE